MNSKKIAIIGAGPIGLYTAIKCQEAGYDYDIFESTNHIGGQIMQLYPEKEIVNIPGIECIKGKDYIGYLMDQIDCSKITYNKIITNDNLQEMSQMYDFVIIATGLGVYSPRKLQIEGEANNNKVLYSLDDYSFLDKKRVIIFGGGDSALDWAKQLSSIAQVTLVHRRDEFRGNADTIKNCLVQQYLSYVPVSMDNNYIVIKSVKTDYEIKLAYDYIIVNFGMEYQKNNSFMEFDNTYQVGDCFSNSRTIASGMARVNEVFKLIGARLH